MSDKKNTVILGFAQPPTEQKKERTDKQRLQDLLGIMRIEKNEFYKILAYISSRSKKEGDFILKPSPAALAMADVGPQSGMAFILALLERSMDEHPAEFNRIQFIETHA